MKYIQWLPFLLFFLSCNKQELSFFVLPEETPIKGIDYPNDIMMKHPWSIEIKDDTLLLFAVNEEHIIRVVDANTGIEIRQTGLFGNGPGEFITPKYWGINKDKEVYIYDGAQKKLRKYSWDDIINAPELPKKEGISLENIEALITSGKILNENFFVGVAVVGMLKPIVVFDKKLNVIENMGAVPDEEHQSKSLATYNGTVSVFGNKFVSVMASLGYIACYEQQKEGISKLLWEHYVEKPIYKGFQLDQKQLKWGFPDVKMTKNYIFCSYYGQRYERKKRKTFKPRNILVFDHQGNLLKNLRTDRSVARITVSADEKTLYAITEEPEVAIIRFDISDIIK